MGVGDMVSVRGELQPDDVGDSSPFSFGSLSVRDTGVEDTLLNKVFSC